MKEPVGCVLWERPELVLEGAMKDRFELIDTFVKESHWWRYLLKCRECGQSYFFEFYEKVDWEGGNDPQYSTYIPVDTDEEAAVLKGATPTELLSFSPRLQKDFPADAKEPKAFWVK